MKHCKAHLEIYISGNRDLIINNNRKVVVSKETKRNETGLGFRRDLKDNLQITVNIEKIVVLKCSSKQNYFFEKLYTIITCIWNALFAFLQLSS